MKEMALFDDLVKVFNKTTASSSYHKKYLIYLRDLFNKVPVEEFTTVFFQMLHKIFVKKDFNIYVKNSVTFAASFCADIAHREEENNHPQSFLTLTITKALEYSDLIYPETRLNACKFISLILQNIGDEVNLDNDLCNEIQKAMLDLVVDEKGTIRLEAMSALVRLQDPYNVECPVIKAYNNALQDLNAHVRKEALHMIAPTTATLPRIKDRVCDADEAVRTMAYQRCADIGPKNFRIIDRQMILTSGFTESSPRVRNFFLDYLVPKWLTAFNGSFLLFLKGLQLNADDADIRRFVGLGKKLVGEFYKKHALNDLIATLPLEADKLVPIEAVTSELALFWNVLASLLRAADDMEEFLDSILPELTPFCNYIDRFIAAKSKEKLEEWMFLDYQFNLLNLFEIADQYDLSDEVGRRTLQSLVLATLHRNDVDAKVTKKLVAIAQKCSSTIDFFTNDMCQIISDVREPLVVKVLSEDELRQRRFQIAKLEVKMNILMEEHSDALEARDYPKAQILDHELTQHRKELEQLQDIAQPIVVDHDHNRIHCLDIIIGVMELAAVKQMTPSLMSCKDNFVLPLLKHNCIKTHCRVLNCITLFSILDKNIAKELAEVLSIPIETYRTIPNDNVEALLISVCGITDLLRLYGPDVIGESNEATTNHNTTTRRLYNVSKQSGQSNGNLTLSSLLQIFLDMLDDENSEIRNKVVVALVALVLHPFPITAAVFSRVVLKWFNPTTDSFLITKLGLFLEAFAKLSCSKEIIQESILLILVNIANAPRTSPLADLDVDNVNQFLMVLLDFHSTKDDWKSLALDVCMKISEDYRSRAVPSLAKFLCLIEFPNCDVECMTEVIERAQILQEGVQERMVKRNIEKFISKLKQEQTRLIQSITSGTNVSEITEPNSINATSETVIFAVPEAESTRNKENGASNATMNGAKEPLQVKRKKRGKSKALQECVVRLERLTAEKKNEETLLHTIIENSMEMMDLDDTSCIDAASTTSTNSYEHKTRGNVIVSETSDSEFSTGSEGSRRSIRLRKKRLVQK